MVVDQLPLPVHFDDSEHTWVIGAASGGFDIETVALHEIGHILGLEHSAVSGAVMFPSVSSNFTLRALQEDDLAGLRQLYPHTPIRPHLAAAANADGRLEVFAMGMDGALWNDWQTAPSSGPWSGWNRVA